MSEILQRAVMQATSPSMDLPAHVPVVVIGGGIMGCSTLYHLVREGVPDAILLERNQLASGTTWHSAAQVRALRSTRSLTELIRYSISLYQSLEEETGQATGWISKGSLSIATHPDRLTHIRRQEALAGLFGVRAQSVSRGEALERWPLMNAEDVIGAVWSPDDGRVSPSDLCAALARGARSGGARIFEGVGVRGIRTRAGRVTGVETDRGPIGCDAIALCAGLWSRKVAALAGAAAPVWPCEHFYLLTGPVEGAAGNLPTLSDHDGHLYIRDDSGGLLVGCFEPVGKAIDPDLLGDDFAFQLLPEDWEHFEPMMTHALHRLPALATAPVRTLLNGPESFTFDGNFLLGEVAETRGLFLGCGMNSVGVATAGGAGMALAQVIHRGRPPFDLGEADPKRFPACVNSAAALAARAPEVLGGHYEIAYPGRQRNSARMLRTMPLHAVWTAKGAHFGQFHGFERPLYFGKEREPELTLGQADWFGQVGGEVEQAHLRAAVFDQSALGKIAVTGKGACGFLDRVCTNRMDVAVGRARYTTLLNERGGIVSDMTAVRMAGDSFRLTTGTAAIGHDLAWLREHLEDEAVELRDVTEDLAVFGLMGPKAAEIAVGVGAEELMGLRYFEAGPAEIAGLPVQAVRMSYVGEAGWEITCEAGHAPEICAVLLEAGVRPAGLFAQTSMRIEKRFLAHGHDIDSDTTPLEAGIGFCVAWAKPFLGRDALLRQQDAGTAARLVTVVLDDAEAVPLGSEPVWMDGRMIGRTTSAGFGYRIGRPVAIADMAEADARTDGAAVTLDIAGTLHAATVRTGAAFDPEGVRVRSLS